MPAAAPVEIGASLVLGWSLWCFLRSYFQAQLPTSRATGRPRTTTAGGAVSSRLSSGAADRARSRLRRRQAVDRAHRAVGRRHQHRPRCSPASGPRLALSFGSQALVRDIVSGSSSWPNEHFDRGVHRYRQAQGTVERITLAIGAVAPPERPDPHRAVRDDQPDHQTTPATGRRWKFLIRLDHACDLENGVGRSRDRPGDAGRPDWRPEFLLPLKMQGCATRSPTRRW